MLRYPFPFLRLSLPSGRDKLPFGLKRFFQKNFLCVSSLRNDTAAVPTCLAFGRQLGLRT